MASEAHSRGSDPSSAALQPNEKIDGESTVFVVSLELLVSLIEDAEGSAQRVRRSEEEGGDLELTLYLFPLSVPSAS